MSKHEPGYYWVRYTQGPMRGQVEVAHRSEESWWFLARETSRTDAEREKAGIEVLQRVERVEHRTLTKAELSLLLFFETCAVDHGGLVSLAHMNQDDLALAKLWNASGFVAFGRVASDYLDDVRVTAWCKLSPAAWDVVHAERRARAARLWESRNWQTTQEKRAT